MTTLKQCLDACINDWNVLKAIKPTVETLNSFIDKYKYLLVSQGFVDGLRARENNVNPDCDQTLEGVLGAVGMTMMKMQHVLNQLNKSAK